MAVLQDSGADGAGYETAIKGGAIAAAGKPRSRPGSKPGTKKVRATCFVSSFVGYPDFVDTESSSLHQL